MARSQEDRKTETRSRLLAAAAEQFASRGFHAVSVDAVADAAERTSGSVYAHFGGKEGLLFALLSAWESETAERMAAALDSSTPGERPAALWSTFAESDGSWMLLEHELWLYAARNPEAADEIARRYRSGRRGMADAFERWAAESDAAPTAPAEQRAAVVLALLFGLEMQRRVDPGSVPDDLAIAALSMLVGANWASDEVGEKPRKREKR